MSQWDELIEWHKPLLIHLLFNCDDSVAHSDDSLRVIVPVNANKCITASLFGVKFEVSLPKQGHCQEANIKRNIIIQIFTKKASMYTKCPAEHLLTALFIFVCKQQTCGYARTKAQIICLYIQYFYVNVCICWFVCVCCLLGGTYMMWSY